MLQTFNCQISCKLKTFIKNITGVQPQQRGKTASGSSLQPQLLSKSDSAWEYQHWTQFLASIWSLGTRLSHAPQNFMWILLIWVTAKGSNCLPFIIYHCCFKTAEWLLKRAKDISALKMQHWDRSPKYKRLEKEIREFLYGECSLSGIINLALSSNSLHYNLLMKKIIGMKQHSKFLP